MADNNQEQVTTDGTAEARAAAIAKMRAAQEREKAVLPDEQGGAKTTESVIAEEIKSEGKKQKKSKKQDLDLTIIKRVKVYSPFHVYFDGEASSLSAINGTGPFDVLPGHKNFLSILQPCDLTVRSERGTEVFKIDRGVLHVSQNDVIVFLDV